MEKKELSSKKIALLMVVAIIFLVVGLALKHRANLPNINGESDEAAHADSEPEEIPSNASTETPSIETVNSPTGESRPDTNGDYDTTGVPIYMDGVNLEGNSEWITYYARSESTSAYIVANNLSSSYDVNFFEVNGERYSLPMSLEDFPWEESVLNNCTLSNYTELFDGNGYGDVDVDLQMIWGNMVYLQCYPGSDVVNAVHIDVENMMLSDTSFSASIAGISVGMNETEVINRYGEGTRSSRDFHWEMAEEAGITNYQDTVYKNSSGILVVSYNTERVVVAISLYSSSLNLYE